MELRKQSKILAQRATEMEKKFRTLKVEQQQQQTSVWREKGESRALLQQTNQHLREQIQLLEQNMNMTDKERALMIFGNMNWSNFGPDTRGVLKIGKKSKF